MTAMSDRMPCREEINDRAKLILHRLIARELRSDPELARTARERLVGVHAPRPDYVDEWIAILEQSPAEIARTICERSERMTRLRAASPFSMTGKFQDPDWRRRVWQKANLALVVR